MQPLLGHADMLSIYRAWREKRKADRELAAARLRRERIESIIGAEGLVSASGITVAYWMRHDEAIPYRLLARELRDLVREGRVLTRGTDDVAAAYFYLPGRATWKDATHEPKP